MCDWKKQNPNLKPSLVPVSVCINMYVIQQTHRSCELYLMPVSQNLREEEATHVS